VTSVAELATSRPDEELPGEVAAVQARGLTKVFPGGQVAVDGIDLLVPRGSVYGFLGPNGSGKTTTIRMLLGLVSPTAGEVELLGVPVPERAAEVLPSVGTLVEGPAFHPFLSGRANLERLDAVDATADPRTSGRRITDALHRVGLTAAAGKKYRRYSLGMKQRLGLAAALLQPRELLVLDEPTNGLDPQGTREVRALVRELADDGVTVVLSTHLLTEVEQVCTHAGIMSRGRLLAHGTLAELGAHGRPRLRVETDDLAVAAAVLDRLGLEGVEIAGDAVHADLGDRRAEAVCAVLVQDGVGVRGLAVQRPTLEDVFVSLTGEGFDVAR
jgi:ABC-2 type transport system ATP-binding protein